MNPITNPSRILYVSKNPAVRDAIGRTLGQAGLAITEAEGPADALEEIEKRLPDLVLLDLAMPGVDGHELCTQIRQQPRAAHLPVLFMLVGHMDDRSKERDLNNGADGYLNWPENRDILVASIKSVLRLRQAETRLRESEQQFRATFEQAGVGLGHLTLDGEWRCANRRLCQIFGFTQEELLQKSCLDLACPEAQQTLQEHKRRILTEEAESIALEQRCRRKDGSEFWASWTVSLARSPSGEAEHLVVVVDDISVRKWTEENLRLIRAGIDGSSEAIAITDPEGRHSYHNRAFAQMFGYRAAELSEPLAKVALYADPAVGRAVFDAIMHGRAWRGEPGMVTKAGRHIPVEVRADAVRNEQGQLIGLIIVHTDITERRQLEAQLRQAQKMEAVGQLASGVAHDFNNMLAVIRGNADLLLMDGDQFSAAAKEGLNHIVAASDKAASLTRQLLVFSRKQVMQSEPLLLNDLVRNLARMLARTIRENIRLECVYADPLPLVQADPGMLEQVLLNLVVNARDAMPHGGQVQIATERRSLGTADAQANPEARAGEFVCLSVSDTGTGIAPEHLRRVFEPFFTTKEPDKGTGLGLATVYGIVKQHQGWIELSSQLGAGTRFNILLPAISAPVPTASAHGAEANVRGGTERILLVEDDSALRAITQQLLETQGYRVWKAESAPEALVLWRDHASEVDLLLADLVLPGSLSGRGLAERLRQEKPELKVIFMSGYSPEAGGGKTDFVFRLKARFLAKPCATGTILEAVRSCLDEKPPAAAPGEAGCAK
jgi:PAS domain S-box-containing protein